jgi:hypothetical protein
MRTNSIQLPSILPPTTKIIPWTVSLAWFRASAVHFRFRCRAYLHDALMTAYLLFGSSYWPTETAIHSFKPRLSQWFKIYRYSFVRIVNTILHKKAQVVLGIPIIDCSKQSYSVV